ncbi:hypothetical protein AUP68_13423 [Ilyonectria robusta]
MKFSVAVATIAVMVASALPIHNFQKREIGGILTCTGVNATGTCHYEVYELDKCHQLPEPFHANINTFAPDGEAFSCYPRTTDCDGICRSPTGCTFGSVDFNYEHKSAAAKCIRDGKKKTMNGKTRLYDVTDVNYAEFRDGSFVLIGKGAATGQWVTYTGRKVFGKQGRQRWEHRTMTDL